jgi:bifunctional enzyme CysN/CysC
MPWYNEGTVLGYLENVHVSSDRNLIDLRVPVQYVIRTDEFRGYAGPVASGIIRKGDTIKVLGKQHQSTVKSLKSFSGDIEEAFSPQPVTIELDDDIDISRGDILVKPENTPPVDDHIESMVVWMDEQPLIPGNSYYIKHNTKMLSSDVDNIVYKIDLDTARRADSSSLGINDVGRVLWSMHNPTIREKYINNRNTGRFIIVDKISNATVGAGIILDKRPSAIRKTTNSGVCVWLTGLSGSGKTTIAKELVERLRDDGLRVEHLDGDTLRGSVFASDVGFDKHSRDLHIARVMFLSKLLVRNGVTVVASFISPYREARDAGRKDIDNFIEVYIRCNVAECEIRDPKGLYKKVRAGEIRNFTGIDDPYEEPTNPHLTVDTTELNIDSSVARIYKYIRG